MSKFSEAPHLEVAAAGETNLQALLPPGFTLPIAKELAKELLHEWPPQENAMELLRA